MTGNGNLVCERVSALGSHGSCAVWKGKAYMYKREREREVVDTRLTLRWESRAPRAKRSA